MVWSVKLKMALKIIKLPYNDMADFTSHINLVMKKGKVQNTTKCDSQI